MKSAGTTIGVILIVVLLVLVLGGAGMMGLGGFGMGPGMMGGYGGMMGRYGPFGFGFTPLVAILSVVFWALVIGGIVLLVMWFVRNAGWSSFAPSTGEPPLDTLKARYAKGEINKQQYEELKRDLT